jgi:hypothetical protein
MTCGIVGSLCTLLVQGGSTPRTFSSGSERYAVITEGMNPAITYSGMQYGIGEIGQRKGYSTNMTSARRVDTIMYEGMLILECSRGNLQAWLPRALHDTGTIESEYAPESFMFDIMIRKGSLSYRYRDCVVNEMSVYGQEEGLMLIAIHILASSFLLTASWPSPAPAIDTLESSIPYMLYDARMIEGIDENEILLQKVALSIKNNFYPVMKQSIGPQKFRSRGRGVALSGKADSNINAIQLLDGSPNLTLDVNLQFGLLEPDDPPDAEYKANTVVEFNLKDMQNTKVQHPNITGRSFLDVPFHLVAGKPDKDTSEITVTFA